MTSHSAPVAVIGAGISGLSCAQALHQAGVETHLFEKANRVGGRCATRLWQGHLVDHGVPYFTARSLEFKRELLDSLRQFRLLIPPILDWEKRVVHSDSGPRFYVLQGNNYFAHLLSHGLDVRLSTPVEKVVFKDEIVECRDGRYRAAVSSLPAPQTADLFSLAPPATADSCRLSAVLEYGEPNVGEFEDCYARVFPDDSEALAASYCENHKSGRIRDNKTVFILHASPGFSAAHADLPEEDFVPRLARAHEELWKIPAGRRTASFGHRWKAGRETRPAFALPPGAFVCGDTPGESTVEDAWLDGRRAAAEVLAWLTGAPARKADDPAGPDDDHPGAGLGPDQDDDD